MEKRKLKAAICLLLIYLLPVPVALACSWDYPIWMIRSKTADPFYRFIKNGKAGYIDRSGKIVVEPKLEAYDNSGDEFHDGLLHTSVSESQYVDTTGKLVLDKGYYRGWDFSDGLAAAMKNNGEKWGYIDRSGEFVISPRFAGYPNGYVHPFSEGLAMIEVGKKYGYIDHSGEFTIQPRFLFGMQFQDGMARVIVEGPCSYFRFGPCPESRTFGESNGKQLPGCKIAFIDKAGQVISGERYDDAKDFSEGLAPILKGEKWGYIDKQGRMVIEPKFDDAEPFSDGLARIKQGELWGYIDSTGKLAIGAQFESAQDFSDGLAVVGKEINDRGSLKAEFYYIDKNGVQAIAEKFDLASDFFKGLAHVRLKSDKKNNSDRSGENGTYAYIEVTGKKVFTYSPGPSAGR